MENTSRTRRLAQQEPISLLERTLTALFAGLVIFWAGALLFALSFQIIYLGKIYPGISVAGIDLSGVRRTEAAALLEEKFIFPRDGLLGLQYEDQTWFINPGELGLALDAETTAERAYQIGRQGWPWTRWSDRYEAWHDGITFSPELVLDENLTQSQLNLIAAEINRPTIEASLTINGLDVVVNPGQVGLTLDLPATIEQITAQMQLMQDGFVPVVLIEEAPVIMDASAQAAVAREILSQPMVLKIAGAGEDDLGPWTFAPSTLAEMLTIERVRTESGEEYQVGLDANALSAFLAQIAPGLTRQPSNARVIFNDDTRQLEVIQPAIIGRELLIEESILFINQELLNGEHRINLVFDLTNPAITDDVTAEELGITELVSAETTYFYGSSAGRIQNIQTAAAQFHGLLIPPGATFSMVENIGDISLDSGYAEALIIFGDRTIQGVGGGVCQVSTTLFRTVFFGGFPVVERYSHAYRVYYYELAQSGAVNENLAGLDATVYAPLIDFRFTNDTPYWLLMETYVYPANRSITWKFYSTSDGRSVEWETTGLRNIVEPPNPVYEENEELNRGVIEQVDWAVEGADVSITRIVWRDGSILYSDEFNTHYEPWATVCQYGPNTRNYPPPERRQDPYSCDPVENNNDD